MDKWLGFYNILSTQYSGYSILKFIRKTNDMYKRNYSFRTYIV